MKKFERIAQKHYGKFLRSASKGVHFTLYVEGGPGDAIVKKNIVLRICRAEDSVNPDDPYEVVWEGFSFFLKLFFLS